MKKETIFVLALVAIALLGGPLNRANAAETGTIRILVGLSSASITSNGMATSKSVIGNGFGGEYLYPIASKFDLGASALHWSLPGSGSIASSSDTSAGLALRWRASNTEALRLVVGKGVRLGLDYGLGKGKGLFTTAEFVIVNKDQTESFGFFGLGYGF